MYKSWIDNFSYIGKDCDGQSLIKEEETIKISKGFLVEEHFYIQGFNLIGCTNVNLTNLGEKEYNCTDFYIDYDYKYKDKYSEVEDTIPIIFINH